MPQGGRTRPPLQRIALVNGLLVGIWAISSPGVFFWPLFPIVGWGIGVVLHGWDVYFANEPDEARIRRMMDELQRKD